LLNAWSLATEFSGTTRGKSKLGENPHGSPLFFFLPHFAHRPTRAPCLLHLADFSPGRIVIASAAVIIREGPRMASSNSEFGIRGSALRVRESGQLSIPNSELRIPNSTRPGHVMNAYILRPNVSDLVFQLYGRPLHPELFDILAVRKIQREDYSLSVRITRTGHVVTWENADVVLTEVATAA